MLQLKKSPCLVLISLRCICGDGKGGRGWSCLSEMDGCNAMSVRVGYALLGPRALLC